MHLPGIVDKRMEDVALELRIGNGGRICRHENVSQQEFGEGVAAVPFAGFVVAFGWKVNTPRENWLPIWLKFCRLYSNPKREGVLAMDPRQLVNELQCVVVVCERTIVGVADAGEPTPVEYDVRNSPGDRSAGILVRDADVGNHIQHYRRSACQES